LEDLGDISEVESIERFSGSGSEFSFNSIINMKNSVNESLLGSLDWFSELAQEELDNDAKDGSNGIFIEISVCEHVEMSDKSVGNEGSTTSWGSHGSEENKILEISVF
jgi:hypothetical protein